MTLHSITKYVILDFMYCVEKNCEQEHFYCENFHKDYFLYDITPSTYICISYCVLFCLQVMCSYQYEERFKSFKYIDSDDSENDEQVGQR